MSRSVSAASSVTNTSPCWNGFIVPGATLMYGSSFCMVTRKPREVSNRPRLEAVRPLPREDATPPVTKMCLVIRGDGAKSAPVSAAAVRWHHRPAGWAHDEARPRNFTLTSAPGPGRPGESPRSGRRPTRAARTRSRPARIIYAGADQLTPNGTVGTRVDHFIRAAVPSHDVDNCADQAASNVTRGRKVNDFDRAGLDDPRDKG